MHSWQLTVKSILTWLSLFLVMPAVIASVKSDGYTQIIFGVGAITLAAVAWNWRSVLNTVRNTELTHSVHVLNNDGDARYEQRVSLLPMFWKINEHKLSLMNFSEDGRVLDVSANCEINWELKDNSCWKGLVKVPDHIPLFSLKKGTKGAVIAVTATFPGAYARPPYGLTAATTKHPPRSLRFRVSWDKGIDVNIVDLFEAPYPIDMLMDGNYDPSKLPFKKLKTEAPTSLADGKKLIDFEIPHPKKSHIYRLLWSNTAI